jgi:energy-coupling factor transporter ATP-binding protein EcfA2
MLDTTASADLVAHLSELADAGTAVVLCEHREAMVRAIPSLRTLRLETAATPRVVSAPFPCSPCDHAPRLEVKGLTVRLGGRTVLQDLSFSAAGGVLVAVVARNGIGKTTLLRALAGLQPAEGEVCVDGRRPDLGMVFQNADLQLFNGTGRDEILYRVPNPDVALYNWLVESLGLSAYETTPPLLLSEGEKKRVALATVLMRRPRDGLLLDEPAVGQDTAQKALLVRLARELTRAGQIVLVTTHDLALAVQADRLLLLDRDGFVADGPPATVLADRGAWERLGLLVPDWVRAGPQAPEPENGPS